jgi:hypothetical protein
MRSAVRTATVAMLALAGAAVSACDKASDEPGDEATVAPNDEATVDPGDRLPVESRGKATVTPGDEECDERHFGDYKTPDDFCWAPPSHYCAQGAGGARTEACDPETGVCCTYGTTCIPCGFVDCTHCLNRPDRPADCPDLCFGAHSSDPKACKQPDRDLVICYRE